MRAYVYSWSSGTVSGNTLVMQREALCIPGGTEGKMKTQNMHIRSSGKTPGGGAWREEREDIFPFKDV